MSLDPVTCCWCYGSVDWAGAFILALLCAPATMLLALWQCSSEDGLRPFADSRRAPLVRPDDGAPEA
jgi:hypothetical protein